LQVTAGKEPIWPTGKTVIAPITPKDQSIGRPPVRVKGAE
jgi:hypothetical protein